MPRHHSSDRIVAVGSFIAGAVCILIIAIAVGRRSPATGSVPAGPAGAPPVVQQTRPDPAVMRPRVEPGQPVLSPDDRRAEVTRPGGAESLPVIENLRGRQLLIPVEGIEAGSLRSSFSETRSGGRAHEAIDILAPRHTPVRAVEDGTIEKLFVSKAGGNTIYQFDPEERYTYYYAHLERYAPGLREGDAVGRGAVIGYVGTSGNAPADTPHLHFAIFRLNADRRWWEGDPVDPFKVFVVSPVSASRTD
jgi:murein DD-endopeptidase MepM/ murein hydrolase activator NlpD